MSDDSNSAENHTVALLREICERLAHIGAKRDEQAKISSERNEVLDVLVNAASAIDRNKLLQTGLLKELTTQGENHGARLNDVYGRLGLIERRVGLGDV